MHTEGPLERLCEAKAGYESPSVLVVAAHPDDETIGAGARITKLAKACTVVHVTDGAPSDRRFFPAAASTLTRAAYARVRRDEALHALALAGVDESRVLSMAVHDQAVAFAMATIAERLAAMLLELRPAIVLTHAYEGGHPDHDATAFATHAAVALTTAPAAPTLIEMTSYHDEGGATVRGEFLPFPGVRELTKVLTDDDRRLKRAMLSAYATQREILTPFKSETERFRLAPRYRFDHAPHDGRLHYERFGFGVSGAMWRALVRAALKKLRLDEGPL